MNITILFGYFTFHSILDLELQVIKHLYQNMKQKSGLKKTLKLMLLPFTHLFFFSSSVSFVQSIWISVLDCFFLNFSLQCFSLFIFNLFGKHEYFLEKFCLYQLKWKQNVWIMFQTSNSVYKILPAPIC